MIENIDKSQTEKLFDSFSCCKSKDVEYFLKNKSIDFEGRNKSRTFIVIDFEKLQKRNLSILAYFTLSLKSFKVHNKKVKSTLRKKMDGFNKKAIKFESFLIGQLGRNDTIKSSELPGKDLLNMAISFISRAQKIVGGRIVLIDCENNDKLIKFYEENDFILIQDHSEKSNFVQMIRVLTI